MEYQTILTPSLQDALQQFQDLVKSGFVINDEYPPLQNGWSYEIKMIKKTDKMAVARAARGKEKDDK